MTNPVSTTIPLSVLPGPATRVQSQMQAGTLLRNNDPVNAVWISENSAVVPNYGWKLAAGGSMVWQVQGSECWAVVDTGVAKSVPIIIGNSISDVQDPVAVGVAVATQLLAQGIPQVFLGKQVYVGTIPGTGSVIINDLNQYASCVLVFTNLKNIGVAVFEWWDSTSGQRVSQNQFEQEFVGGSGSTGQFSMQIPVKGDQLVVTFAPPPAGPAIGLQIFASNRIVPYDRVNPWEITSGIVGGAVQSVAATQAYTAGVAQLIGTLKSYGLPAKAHLFSPIAGGFGFLHTDGSGAQNFIYLDSVHAGAFDVFVDILIPPGNLSIEFTPTNNSGAVAISAVFIQELVGV